MRSTFGGQIATFLICIPLVAVPVVAVIGMPRWAALSASAHEDDLTFADDKSAASKEPAPHVEQSGKPATEGVPRPPEVSVSSTATDTKVANEPHHPAGDPFAEFNSSGPRPTDPSPSAKKNWSPPGERLEGWAIDEGHKSPQKPLPSSSHDDSSSERTKSKAVTTLTGQRQSLAGKEKESIQADVFGGAERPKEVRDSQSVDDPLTWKAAVTRLKAFGIRDYRLQPGSTDGEIHFSCNYVSRNNPRVTRRFEAEGAEPLDAFRKVLQQIDECQRSVSRTSDQSPTSDTQTSSAGVEINPQRDALENKELSIDVTNR